jgi:thiamine transporter
VPTRGTREIALVGVVAALSLVLGTLGWTQVNGGRVSLADIPILVLALTSGAKAGISAGIVAGFLHYTQQPISMHPLGFILDFPLASGCIGLAGLVGIAGGPLRVGVAVFVAVAAKYVVHVVSGVLFWSQGLPPGAAWVASASYNASYMGPMLALDLLVVVPLAGRLQTLGRR